MDRECYKCVYYTNTCTKWSCQFETLEEHDKQIRAEERAKMYEIINDIYDSIEYPNEDDAQWFNNIIDRLEQLKENL